MADGGEVRAFFIGARDGAADTVESAANKMADLGDAAAQNVRDSVGTLRNAEGANIDAINGIRGKLDGDGEDGLPSSGSGSEGNSSSQPNRIARQLSGDDPESPSADGRAASPAQSEPPLPPYLKKRFEEGQAFNKENWPRYPHNEVTLKSGKRVDSYRPGREIVERKKTQLSEVERDTAKGYINSLRSKYDSGQPIGNTPKNRAEGISGKTLAGRPILEVPPQAKDVPKEILDYARVHGVIIRDTNGKVYR
jgi:hypothetical protein